MVGHLLVWQDPVALALLRSALVLFATLWAPVANVCQRPGSTNGVRLISILGNELWTCELYWIVMLNPDWRPWRMCSQRSSRAVPTSTSSHVIPAVTTHSCHRKSLVTQDQTGHDGYYTLCKHESFWSVMIVLVPFHFQKHWCWVSECECMCFFLAWGGWTWGT